ncbi:MAG: MFS transporter [Chloroflexota bacterium]|nr:MFS transporter [Chloroflexota bacterium]
MTQNHPAARSERDFRAYLPIILLTRITTNTSFRIVYPFLSSIARGLGISLEAASGLITLRWIAGMGAPFFGPLADRHGRRRVMEVALLLFMLACLLLAGIGTFTAAAIAFALYGLVKSLYDPAVHAYVGDTVPFHERGRAVGMVELAWSAAWLLGVPASGFLIERFGWRAPWAVLFVFGLFGIALTRTVLPPAPHPAASSDKKPLAVSTLVTWRELLSRRSVVVFLLINLLLTLANEIPLIVYGSWLETSFGLSLAKLGLASTVVGLAEAAAELGATMVTDRLGKRRSVLAGLLGLAVSLIALPWLARLGLAAALTGVVCMMLTFEFGWVSLLPLGTELAPEARATLLSLNVTSSSIARAVGTLIGGWLWRWQRIGLHAGVGTVCALVAAFLLVWGVEDG